LIFRNLLEYRRDAVLSIVSALIWMVLMIAGPYVEKLVIDRAITGGRRDLLGPLIALLLIVGGLKALGVGGRRWFAFRLSYRAETDIRNRIFEHTQRLTFSYHDATATGELMARASSDLNQVRLIYAMMPITIANLCMFGAVGAMLIVLDPFLGLITGLSIPLMAFLALVYARRVLATSFEVQQRLAEMNQSFEQLHSKLARTEVELNARIRDAPCFGRYRRIVDRSSSPLYVRRDLANLLGRRVPGGQLRVGQQPCAERRSVLDADAALLQVWYEVR